MPNPAGRLTGIAYPNGVAGTLAYEDADRLTSIAYADGMTALETIAYVVDAVGNRTSMTDSSGTTDYTYDALYRLTEVEYPNSDLTEYGYDAVGNRTSLTINGGTPITNTYNDANALTASGSDTYSYDDNGNLTSKTVGSATTTYTWDALNRMTGLGDGTSVATYDYNGDGLRVASRINSATTNFAWDQTGLGNVIAIDDDEYVRGHGLISQMTSGTTPTYAHADGLGSVRLLTDGTAAIAGTETYDAFGASRAQTGTQLPFSFAGELADAESGFVYLRARYMDPVTGLFLSRDPFAGVLDVPVTLHRYLYTAANPINLIDPSGLSPDNVDVCHAPPPRPNSPIEDCKEEVALVLAGLGVSALMAAVLIEVAIVVTTTEGLLGLFGTLGGSLGASTAAYAALEAFEACLNEAGHSGTPRGHFDPVAIPPSLPGGGGGGMWH